MAPAPQPLPQAAGPRTCPAPLRTVFARAAGAPVRASAEASAGLIVCRYVAPAARGGRCTAASVSIFTGPQAYRDFSRWVVETTQNSSLGPGRPGLAPVQMGGIGLESDWVPATLTYEAATLTRWVAVMLTCPSSGAAELGLARSLTRPAISAT